MKREIIDIVCEWMVYLGWLAFFVAIVWNLLK